MWSICFVLIWGLLSSPPAMKTRSHGHSFIWTLVSTCGHSHSDLGIKTEQTLLSSGFILLCVWSLSLAAGTLLQTNWGLQLVPSSTTCPVCTLTLMGSAILPRLNSGGEKQQERDEPGGDPLTLRRVITSLGPSYANVFISKSTVII